MTSLARSVLTVTLVLGLGGIAVAQGMKKSDPHAAGHAVQANDLRRPGHSGKRT